MKGSPQQYLLIGIVIALLALAMRVPGLNDFMTADEENWLLRSGSFWHELFLKKHPAGTFQTTHPGAVTMWIAGAGITWQEIQLGYNIDTSNLLDFRAAALWPLVITTSLLIGIVAALLAQTTGRATGVIGGGIIATDPYLTGLSQVVHLDALLALLMLIAALLWLWHLQTKRFSLLIWAGAMAGIAAANKMLPALWLVPFFGMTALLFWRPRSVNAWLEIAARVAFTACCAALAFAITWPAAWAYGDTTRYFKMDVPSVVTQAHSEIDTADPIAPASFYPRTLLGRTSPIILILVAGAVILLVARVRGSQAVVWYWLTYASGFLILISFIAKKGDRYAVPALLALMVIAAVSLVNIWPYARTYIPRAVNSWRPLSGIAILLVIGGLIAQRLAWTPYAIAYHTPWDRRPLPQQGWGEGLDAAARWLNERPLSEQMHIASWYPSVTAQYFKGKTLGLNSRHDGRVAYVILYRNMQGRDGAAGDIWGEYVHKKPVHTVTIHGQPYAWIYEQIGLIYFNSHVGELYGEAEVGQTVVAPHNNWHKIAIGLATFSSRSNTHDVVLHVRESLTVTTDLRTVVVNARDIADQAYHVFTFDPIPDAAGKTYYLAITSPTSVPGNAVTTRYVAADLLPGQMVWRPRALRSGQTNEDYLRDHDLAYKFIEETNE